MENKEGNLVKDTFVHNSMVRKPPKSGVPIGEGITFNEETKISLGSNKIQTHETSREDNMGDEEVNGPRKQGPVTFEFPIQDPDAMVQMKNIPLSSLLNFHGFSKEVPITFIFEFDVLCHSYDYSMDAQKLKFFHATLKDATLC